MIRCSGSPRRPVFSRIDLKIEIDGEFQVSRGSRAHPPPLLTSARTHNADLVFLHDAFERGYSYLTRAPNAFKRPSFKFDRRIR